MKNAKTKIIFGLAATTLGAFLLVNYQNFTSAPPVHFVDNSNVWPIWIADLKSQGYAVSQGAVAQQTSTECSELLLPIFGGCFGNNPLTPYIVPQPPVGAANAFVDPMYALPFQGATADGTVTEQYYQLDTTEAIVTIINLPPLAAYFGFQTYAFTRPISLYRNGVGKVSPDPQRAQIFASFNNSVNNVDIQKQSGFSFGGGTIAIITTANMTLAKDLSDVFQGDGGNKNWLFNEVMGTSINPGYGFQADDFNTVVRYAIPADSTQSSNWTNNLSTNMQVYRIAIKPSDAPGTRFGAVTVNNRYYNVSEQSHKANLHELASLLQGWLATQENNSKVAVHGSVGSIKVTTDGVPESGIFGPYCLSTGASCVGDSQDTDSYKSGNVGKMAENQMAFFTGVNHAVTNNATYTSATLIDASVSTGILSASQTNPQAAGFTSGVLTGSAYAVLSDLGLLAKASPSLVSDLPNLYVHLYGRSQACTSAQNFCTASYTSIFTDAQAPLTDGIKITERAYLLPGYANGANPDYLLNPYVIY